MKIITRGEDRWRDVVCRECRSVLWIENQDVIAIRCFDTEDRTEFWRFMVSCDVCHKRVYVNAPPCVAASAPIFPGVETVS